MSISLPPGTEQKLDRDALLALVFSLEQKLDTQGKELASVNRELSFANQKIHLWEERWRLHWIQKYGKRSEKMPDLQLQ